MTVFFSKLLRSFRSPVPVPEHYRRIFTHLYLDIAWFGVLSGTTIAFLSVYATREGATNQQIGMLTAVPGLVNLLFALPAGSWLSRRSLGRAVFWSIAAQRAFYLLLIPLPVMLMPHERVWVILATTLLMTIPGTAGVVGFNAMFGEVVPVEWRGHVVGIRNAVLSIVTTVFTLSSGWLLDHTPFATGYQVIFTVGMAGGLMSALHVYLLARILDQRREAAGKAPRATPAPAAEEEKETASPAENGGAANGSAMNGSGYGAITRRLSAEIRAMTNRGLETLRLDAMQGKFARLMGLLFCWHLVQFMTIPIVTPFVVNDLGISDQMIGISGSLFNAMTFIGSLYLCRVTARFGNHRMTGVGIMGLSLFPLLTSLGVGGYVLGNLAGGMAWAMAGGALYNYILEHAPAHDRPAHLAWYSLVSNGAILLGSLSGPAIADITGYVPALVIFGIGRFLAGAAILRWG